MDLSNSERRQIAEILSRRANDIAAYKVEGEKIVPGSVELALAREIKRLRGLADKVGPPESEDEE